MSRHRCPHGRRPDPRLTRRLPSPSPTLRGRVVVAAAAVGALAAAGQAVAAGSAGAYSSAGVVDNSGIAWLASAQPAVPALGGELSSPEVLPVVRPDDPAQDVAALLKAARLAQQRGRGDIVDGQRWVLPAVGVFTSGFGARWGSFHYGVDIANAIGTPIRSVGDGTVVEAGPASGFGLWVRVRLTDGTMTVYGHVNRFLVPEGRQVKAGDVIAEMGNRGYSTGPHLHFEVWTPDGRKVDPLPWLLARGLDLTRGHTP